MPTRIGEAEWKGSLLDGQGTTKVESGIFDARYNFGSRFKDEKGTNPEELIAAAHAACFSMALSGELNKAGYKPNRIHTTAKISINQVGNGFAIQKSELITEADIPGISDDDFQKHAKAAKVTCPVSKALTGVQITVDAKLLAKV